MFSMGFKLEDIQRAMVFAAHPDDEIIGLGGVIHRLTSLGKDICVVGLTYGETSAEPGLSIEEMKARRLAELRESDAILGITNRVPPEVPGQQVYAAVYADNTLHHRLIQIIRSFKPEILFTHSPDNHRDHNGLYAISRESAFQSSERILLGLGEPCPAPTILYYSIEQPLPEVNTIIEIHKPDLDAKMQAIEKHVTQQRDGYLERFKVMIRSRAEFWGAKQFGRGCYAEPYFVDRNAPMVIK